MKITKDEHGYFLDWDSSKENKWYEYDNLMQWDKDDLASKVIELAQTLKKIKQEAYKQNI